MLFFGSSLFLSSAEIINPLLFFPCHSCKKKMNFISQDFSIYMSWAHDPLASPVLKRGIIAAYVQAGTGLQTRLTESGGRIIMYWVLGITADGIYSSHREHIQNHFQWLLKTDSDLTSNVSNLYYHTDTICNDLETTSFFFTLTSLYFTTVLSFSWKPPTSCFSCLTRAMTWSLTQDSLSRFFFICQVFMAQKFFQPSVIKYKVFFPVVNTL